MLNVNDYKRSVLKPFWDIDAPSDDTILKKNCVLQNRHLGERCFILANGPSIKKQKLECLKEEVCIVVSDFDYHQDYNVIKPQYHCISPYHPPGVEEDWHKRMERIYKNSENATMIFGLTDCERNSVDGLFKDRQVHYLKFTGEWKDILLNGIDLTKPVPKGRSVPIMALFVALYMGFKQIFLMGCDHDWILHSESYSYFYKDNQDNQCPKGYNPLFGTDFEAEARWNIILWQQYKMIRRITSKMACRIYNATDGGLLDVFPRVSYESLFNNVENNENVNNFSELEFQKTLSEIKQLQAEQHYGQAITITMRLLDEYPDVPEVINICAELKFQLGSWLDAIQILENLVKYYPANNIALANLGVIYWKIGDDKNALQYFLKAVKINPYHRETILNFVEALKTIKKPDVAKKVISIYLQKYPDDMEVVHALSK